MVVFLLWIIVLVRLIIHSDCRSYNNSTQRNVTSWWSEARVHKDSLDDSPTSRNSSESKGSGVGKISSMNLKKFSNESLSNSSASLDVLLEDTVELMETFELDKQLRRQNIYGWSNLYYTPSITQTARRICNPGPMFAAKSTLKTVLSLVIQYQMVREQLKDLCQVQHGPLPKASGAIDTRYGLQCLDIMLSTASLQTTKYDVILFNFGLHDVNFSGRFPEEYVPLQEYVDNLSRLKSRLQSTGASLVFALTTPVPYNKTLNKEVRQYNTAARRLMKKSGLRIIDLYKTVVKKCGHPPYKKCRIMRKKRDVHYNLEGCKILGLKVARVLRKLLKTGTSQRRSYMSSGMNFQAQLSYACPDRFTHCPYSTTCSRSQGSPTGYGCCMLPQAVNCPDSWHCCPQGTQCSPTCTRNKCSCVIPQNYYTR